MFKGRNTAHRVTPVEGGPASSHRRILVLRDAGRRLQRRREAELLRTHRRVRRMMALSCSDSRVNLNRDRGRGGSRPRVSWLGWLLALVGVALGSPAFAENWRGLTVAPEHRCSPYERNRDYPYPQSVEREIARRLGPDLRIRSRPFLTDFASGGLVATLLRPQGAAPACVPVTGSGIALIGSRLHTLHEFRGAPVSRSHWQRGPPALRQLVGRRRQIVRAMFLGHPTQAPQRFLQSLRERLERPGNHHDQETSRGADPVSRQSSK